MDPCLLPAPPMSNPAWGAERVDLDAYLARIGYDGPVDSTLDTLRRVHRRHADAITWEIIDLAMGRGTQVALDIESLQKKIVHNGRGGSCLETNLLFAAALERLGFPVVRHVARVRRGNLAVRTRSHVVLLVEVDGQIWFADPGFGDESPLEPIPFIDGATHTVGEWTWRLDQEGEEWVLRSLHPDGWFDVYAFRLERQYPVDFDLILTFSCHDPNSVFIGKLVVQRGDDKVRHVLKDRTLIVQYADGSVETSELDGEGIVHQLRTTFKLTITEDDSCWLINHFSVKQANKPSSVS